MWFFERFSDSAIPDRALSDLLYISFHCPQLLWTYKILSHTIQFLRKVAMAMEMEAQVSLVILPR